MGDKQTFLNSLPEIFKSIEGVITGVGALMAGLAGYLGYKQKKKTASESNHAQSFRKSVKRDEEVERVTNLMVQAIPYALEIGIAQWRNGDIPKEFRLIFSTNYNTLILWKGYQTAEPDLVKIQAATLDEGVCLFRPSQLKDPITRDWYDGSKPPIKQTTSVLIAVNELKNESLVMYINYTEEHIVTSETRKLINLYRNQLFDLYEPIGWLAKKNYLKN